MTATEHVTHLIAGAKEAGHYVAGFENEHGEAAVFVCAPGAAAAQLHMEDLDWSVVEVSALATDGLLGPIAQPGGILLTPSEALWLRACWMATHTGKDLA